MVQMNSNRVWKWQWYCLVDEYEQRPFLPVPLAILSHLFLLGKWVFHQYWSELDGQDEPVIDQCMSISEKFVKSILIILILIH